MFTKDINIPFFCDSKIEDEKTKAVVFINENPFQDNRFYAIGYKNNKKYPSFFLNFDSEEKRQRYIEYFFEVCEYELKKRSTHMNEIKRRIHEKNKKKD